MGLRERAYKQQLYAAVCRHAGHSKKCDRFLVIPGRGVRVPVVFFSLSVTDVSALGGRPFVVCFDCVIEYSPLTLCTPFSTFSLVPGPVASRIP